MQTLIHTIADLAITDKAKRKLCVILYVQADGNISSVIAYKLRYKFIHHST